jgi:hypothetical protein
MSADPDPILIIASIATSAVGIVGGWSAVITSRKNQIIKRQEIVLPLIKEFEHDKFIRYAEALIYHIPVQIPVKGNLRKYTNKDLQRLLNGNKDLELYELDDDEITIRSTIDSLLNFFGKLAYLIDIHILTRQDIGYFRDYAEKAAADIAVMEFVKEFHYDLFLLLLDQIGSNGLDDDAREMVAAYKKSTRQRFDKKFRTLWCRKSKSQNKA